MEKQAPESGYKADWLLEKIVERGRASVTELFSKDPKDAIKLAGALEGFELALSMPASYEDFAWIITQRQKKETEMQLKNDNDPVAQNDYLHYHLGTLQLKFCRDILLAAKLASGRPLPPRVRVEPRAVRRYEEIIGIRENPLSNP